MFQKKEDYNFKNFIPSNFGSKYFKNIANDEPGLCRRIFENLKKLWFLNESNLDVAKEAQDATHSVVKVGIYTSIAVILFFGVWAGFAPLDSASVASGTVVLYSNRKTVQHLEGGIVQEILVKEGDEVQIGQPLVRLNYTSANAQQEIYLAQLYLAKATEARLIAERDGLQEPEFPGDVLANKDKTEVIKIMDGQRKLFEIRRNSLMGQIDILQQRIEQYNDQIRGFEAQQKAVENQLSFLRDEISSKKKLLDQGWGQKPEYLALKRHESELFGKQGEYISEIARVKEGIMETQLQILNVQNEFLNETLKELKEVQAQVADLQEKVQASQDVLDRTVIKAPQSGRVTGLNVHTIGGVITPGQPIMDIVPNDDKLIVEAQVPVQDIDVVHKGSSAKVMLSAYKTRVAPRIDGKVIDISADRFTDEKTGVPFYRARIEIDKDAIKNLPQKVELYPGMPAEVFIVTGENTLLNYLMEPITSSFRRSLREQ